MLRSINPFDNALVREYPELSPTEILEITKLSYEAFNEWSQTSFAYRAEKMKHAAEVLRKQKEELSRLMTIEMGKPIVQSRSEIEKCAWVCEYYADNAETFLSDEIVKTDAAKSFIAYRPLGPVLAVMPWNFPFWQVFRFAAPGLMAGNTGILKHASNVTGCALAIEKIFNHAGFPSNVFRTITASSKYIAPVIADQNVKAVTLTGSVPAGKAVSSAAGASLKKTVLELGGSDAYLILEDADLKTAADICVISRLINGGQSCIAAKRFIIVESVYNKFEELFVDVMQSKKMGDPFDEQNHLGPQASIPLRNELHQQVLQSVEKGASILTGGFVPDSKGAFYPPTVLSNVKKNMPAYDDELFGPVASLIKVKDESEGIMVANDTSFGLGAAVFTADTERGEKIARDKLHAGCCFVNDFVKSDPRLPFGGIKESGYGRELSVFGIREFVNIKSVYVK
ncbi:MAG: NAD-dependent succinate-semialdehyde dehydrogenase [Ignavibacteriales bacterium]|nr:MAG: NAD-dependent succinate-semialdehyde dehydrogenase [Ignavibacteriales bacterium]